MCPRSTRKMKEKKMRICDEVLTMGAKAIYSRGHASHTSGAGSEESVWCTECSAVM